MYAVITTGGKQYKVSPGDIIVVEKLLGDAGTKIKLEQVLMVSEEGKKPEVGLPLLSSAAVNCEVIEQSRSDKIIVFKKKRRQGYKRKKGHRQDQTVLRILDINGKGAVKASADNKKQKVTEAKVSESSKKIVDKTKKPASDGKSPSTDTKTTAKSKSEGTKAKSTGPKTKMDSTKKKSSVAEKANKVSAENKKGAITNKPDKKTSGAKK